MVGYRDTSDVAKRAAEGAEKKEQQLTQLLFRISS